MVSASLLGNTGVHGDSTPSGKPSKASETSAGLKQSVSSYSSTQLPPSNSPTLLLPFLATTLESSKVGATDAIATPLPTKSSNTSTTSYNPSLGILNSVLSMYRVKTTQPTVRPEESSVTPTSSSLTFPFPQPSRVYSSTRSNAEITLVTAPPILPLNPPKLPNSTQINSTGVSPRFVSPPSLPHHNPQ